MTKSDDKRVPVLRFKGFTDEWEQRKLGDVLSKFDYGLNSASSDYDGKNKYLRITDIDEQTHRFNLDNLTSPKVDLKNKDNYILHPGDIVFARTGASVGKTYKYREDDGRVYFAGFLIRGRINKNFDASFIFDTTLLPKYSNFVKITSIRSGQPGINSEEYKKYVINIPTINEQKYISKLITNLEELITLQQRKLNDLSSMKSALLQNIFPNTQGIKKIKLSTQEWNLQKISSIFKERNQRNKNGMLLSVSISKGVYPFSENDRKDNSSNDKSNYKEVKINDLAYNSMRMWQGAVGVSKYNGIVSPAYTVITPKKEENPNFYYYYFKNKRMLFNFRQHSQGLTSDTWNLKFPLFEKILIQVPSDKEEEQRISSLFKQLDKSIDLNKIHIEKLTSIKQFLLQNMFI